MNLLRWDGQCAGQGISHCRTLLYLLSIFSGRLTDPFDCINCFSQIIPCPVEKLITIPDLRCKLFRQQWVDCACKCIESCRQG